MTGFAEYEHYDGLGLADLVRGGEVSPEELVEAAIARIEARNPPLNAVIHKIYDQARETASGNLPAGPFAGVPFLLKDALASYAGAPLEFGCRFLDGFVPDHDSELVRRHKAAGLIVVGKTNTPELGLSAVCEPETRGPTRNPWDTDLSPGGSSGGSAAAVASRMVPIAHGSDGGGSLRIPASCCGLFGLRPTRGRNPIDLEVAEPWDGFIVEHVLTRSVRDSAAMLDATAVTHDGLRPYPGCPGALPAPCASYLDEVGRDPGTLRIAYSARPLLPATVHPECIEGLDSTAKLCEDLGHNVVEAWPPIDVSAFASAYMTVLPSEVRSEIAGMGEILGRTPRCDDFEPGTWATALLGATISASDFMRAIECFRRLGRQVELFFTTHDIYLTPTLAGPPLPIGALRPSPLENQVMRLLGRMNAGRLIAWLVDPDRIATMQLGVIPFTPIFNATGHPAMSVPLFWNRAGLPIGMQFVGRYGDEATLFRLAGQLERARPWEHRAPPMD